MSKLSVTLIDVGWGDSVFIESQDTGGKWHYALVDSNDNTYFRSSYIFLKKYFEKKGLRLPDDKPVFDFVLLSHAHTDHGQGLRAIMRAFGTTSFYYPKSLNWSSLAYLIRYSNRSTNVAHHQSIDNTKQIGKLGDVDMEVLWPQHNKIDGQNENNNSVVLALKLDNMSFILTGDAEEQAWNHISNKIPGNTRFFKVPHHGSVNGTFDSLGNTTWFSNCPQNAVLGISSHVRPFSHPDQEVIDLFENHNRAYFRTDEQFHISFITKGFDVEVKYSHI